MLPESERWFAERTWHDPRWSISELVESKRGRTISVVLPALNEQDTVGPIVRAIKPLTEDADGIPLVDELIVVDSGSTDRTVEEATAAGARTVLGREVVPDLPSRPGKGEVLWRSLAATSGDLLVFVDSDLVDFDPAFVPALLGPLLTDDVPALVKGFYRRPLRVAAGTDQLTDAGGGRVTELLARPVLSALQPELSAVIQPLGGEYAARRDFLEAVPFAAGYGVEIGLLLDAHRRDGLDGIAQVNLGVRKHRNRELPELGVMARQILAAALARCDSDSATTRADQESLGALSFTQFAQTDSEWVPRENEVLVGERPPLRDLR